MIIYQITNNVNNKKYIGQTNFTLEKRIAEHLKNANGIHIPTCYIHRAIKKYGSKNFSYEVLCECANQDELDTQEIQFIKEKNTLAPTGYNLTFGGKFKLGMNLFSQHPDKEWVRKRISEGTKIGIALSEKSWVESHLGPKNGMYGRKHSPESIALMKQNRKGKACGDENGMRKPGVAKNQHLVIKRNLMKNKECQTGSVALFFN